MTRKALLITGQESETVSTLARNLIHAGGLSIFARQLKQMKAIGVEEMHVVTDWFAQDFEKAIRNCSARPEKVFLHTTKDAPLKLLEHNIDGNSWLLIEEGVILDDRIVKQVADYPSSTVLSLIEYNEFLSAHTANALPLQLENQEGYFGSLAKLSSGTLTATVRKLSTLEGLPGALKAISRADDCAIVKITNIPLYIPDRHRDVDLVWLPLTRREDGDEGTDVLLDYSQKGILNWPTRYIHRHVENLIVKYLCKCPVTPNQVTVVTVLLGFYVLYLFWAGHMLPGLFGAIAFSILEGVEDKLVRIKVQQTKIGRLIHPLYKLMEYGWYFAFAAYLSDIHGVAPLIMAAALVLFHLADEIQSEFFRRMTGFHIFNTASFDRRFHLIAGRRETQTWALLPFGLFDQWYAGFGFICAYGIITFFVHQLRLVYHLKNIMTENSETFAENFKRTKIL